MRPDPLRGLCEVVLGDKRWVVEYEPDPDLRDTEQVPLLEEGGIEAFMKREVLPYAEDAWYAPASVKIGYEISFTRYFYKPKPLRTLAEIRSDIVAVEREAEGLLGGLLAGEPLARERKLRVLRRHVCDRRLRGRGVPGALSAIDREMRTR